MCGDQFNGCAWGLHAIVTHEENVTNSRLAHRVIAHVTCLPTKLLGESGQQITLAFLPSGWISVLLLILGPPTFQIT